MEVNVTRNNIRAIANYMENGAMALILTAIEQECSRILDGMNKEEENVC